MKEVRWNCNNVHVLGHPTPVAWCENDDEGEIEANKDDDREETITIMSNLGSNDIDQSGADRDTERGTSNFF